MLWRFGGLHARTTQPRLLYKEELRPLSDERLRQTGHMPIVPLHTLHIKKCETNLFHQYFIQILESLAVPRRVQQLQLSTD